VEIWFADECGVEGDPRPRRRWSPRGSAPKVGYKGTHLRSSVVGAVCPDSGESFHMIFDGVDTNMFAFWLAKLAETSPKAPGKRRILRTPYLYEAPVTPFWFAGVDSTS